MDESLSWEERYKQLEAHHKENTMFDGVFLNKVVENFDNLEVWIKEKQKELIER